MKKSLSLDRLRAKKSTPSKSYNKNRQNYETCKKIWPHLFKLKTIRPFSIGFKKELLADAAQRGLCISSGQIHSALYWVSRTKEYQLALVDNSFRFDAGGNISGKVSENHKENAKAALSAPRSSTKKKVTPPQEEKSFERSDTTTKIVFKKKRLISLKKKD